MLPDDDFLSLQNLLVDILTKFIKSIKEPGSWINYYVERLSVKPPYFAFNEPRTIFKEKVILYYDLTELAFLFCKITNPKEYSAESHIISNKNRYYFCRIFVDLSEEQWFKLRNHLKNSVTWGSN